MDSRELIDAQFDRAVEIVQSLPKTGPIQTDYEEKLTMYSLYKQATIGHVQGGRPGMWDMLGRAKWDAWAKHKDLDLYEAKWLYVDALLKVLSKYSDKTVARDLMNELQSYGGDPSNLVMSHSLSRSRTSQSSSSSASENDIPRIPGQLFSSNRPEAQQAAQLAVMEEGGSSSEDDESGDEAHELPLLREPAQQPRPLSSMSPRYRTPVTGSLALSPPPPAGLASVPPMQPMPTYETQSAFADQSAPIASSSAYPPPRRYSGAYQSPEFVPQIQYTPSFRGGRSHGTEAPMRPPSRLPLEQAVENVQTHLAALTERLDMLESQVVHPQRSNLSLPLRGSSGRGSPTDHRPEAHQWDLDDMGMWSFVLKPLSRVAVSLEQLLIFFARGENRSPVLTIVRRLFLDISFSLAVLGLLRLTWKQTATRRKEVNAALILLWAALSGRNRERVLSVTNMGRRSLLF
ncbi:ACBP-domain-containing protein [Suillus paluster]|uniref:ACBP-domain-containing protein n=1 Tax=Suillus paluster TaxID=48578 RepID=UPI001B883EA7|nr:ACBP-domain-containing protein [Suillus paluster]KAG1753740.1 ACBP-domain-containing protein [Suillus paluster]